MEQEKLCANPSDFYSISHRPFEFPLFKNFSGFQSFWLFWVLKCFDFLWGARYKSKVWAHPSQCCGWVPGPLPHPSFPTGVIQRETFEGADVLWDPGSHQCSVDWKSASCVWRNNLENVCLCCSASSWANGLALTFSALLTQYFNLDFYGTGCRTSAAESLRSFLAVKIKSVYDTQFGSGNPLVANLVCSVWLNPVPLIRQFPKAVLPLLCINLREFLSWLWDGDFQSHFTGEELKHWNTCSSIYKIYCQDKTEFNYPSPVLELNLPSMSLSA